MPAKWTGDVVGKMHLHRITIKALAEHMGISDNYVTMVLNGRRKPAGAEQRFKAALDALIKEGKA